MTTDGAPAQLCTFRPARRQREYAIAAGLQPDLDPGTTLVVTDWRYAGRGHPLIDLLAADLASPPPRGGPPSPGS